MSTRERVEALARAAAERGIRALVVIESPPTGSDRSDEPRGPDRADRLAARLGTENPRLVHDARRHLDPGMLAAEAGTVPAGGVLTLLVPPLEPRDAGAPRARVGARFARLLLEYLRAEPGTSIRTTSSEADADALSVSAFAAPASEALPSAADPVKARAREPGQASTEEGPGRGGGPVTDAALAIQDALLERAFAHLTGDDRPLVVVEAPRGHGKSALLGRLAARLEHVGGAPVLCAARRPAVEALERHRRLEGAGDVALPFLAPDAALARGGDLLLVDEAASLPLPLLERLATRWRRLALATTSAGYETAGRAFALRLPAILDRTRPGWLRLTPPEPMRWRAGDPLDALLARVTLANVALPAPTESPFAAGAWPDTAPIRADATRVDRDALARDDVRLASLFGLLAATHYQSTPLDLDHLLDGEHMALWSVEHAGRALGVALVAIEPGVEPALHADVLARRRRLPHRLLPQLLAQSANDDVALEATFARIVRIAVHPAVRRQGIGARLIEAVRRDTRDVVEAVGASFGETSATSAFWRAGGFVTFHRGHRRNARSGRRAVAVLRAGSARTRAALAAAAAIHRDNASAGSSDEPAAGAPRDDELLRRFANGERHLSDTRAALERLVRAAVGHPTPSRKAAPGSDESDGADVLLERLGVDAPSAPRGREARLRDWVRGRLDRAGKRRAFD